MRTTLDIDADVLLAAKELARHRGTTAGKILSDLVRESLTRSSVKDHEDEFYGFRPLPADGVVVTNELIDQLRSEDIY